MQSTLKMSTQLPRQLRLRDALSLVVGTVVGAGIFLVPSIMARHVRSATGILAAWIVAGGLSYFGALAYAELGTMFPATGGQYVFLQKAYGRMAAFLCGWTLFLVVMPGNIAALATGFAMYLDSLLPMHMRNNALQPRCVAIGLIAVVTFINYRGLKAGAFVQNSFTALKLLGITILICAGISGPRPSQLHLSFTAADFPYHQLGLALAGALVAYEGWSNLSFVNGEILDPERTVPIALGLGVVVSTALYLLLTTAYLSVLPIDAIASSTRVGADVAHQVLGKNGGAFLSLSILVSIIGSINGAVLMAPRVYFAQAADGLFFKRFAQIHPRYKTPSFSILMQGTWASVLALSGSYELIATYAIFCAWLFYLLVVFGVMVLRWKLPSLPRPYRMWGYPFTLLAFTLAALWFLVNHLIGNPIPSLMGLAVLVLGIAIYFISYRRELRSSQSARPF
jgi:basic amino acid/polyamine antiporter, APA family